MSGNVSCRRICRTKAQEEAKQWAAANAGQHFSRSGRSRRHATCHETMNGTGKNLGPIGYRSKYFKFEDMVKAKIGHSFSSSLFLPCRPVLSHSLKARSQSTANTNKKLPWFLPFCHEQGKSPGRRRVYVNVWPFVFAQVNNGEGKMSDGEEWEKRETKTQI